MKAIEEITTGGLTLAELETEHRARDAEVQRLRAEQLTIHELLEREWAKEQAAAAGPAHLKQTVGFSLKDGKE